MMRLSSIAFFFALAFGPLRCGAASGVGRREHSHRPPLDNQHSAAHRWACALFQDMSSRLSVIVITGLNVIETRGKAVRKTWGAGVPPERFFMFTDGTIPIASSVPNPLSHIALPGTSGSHGGSQKKWPLAFQHYC